MNPKTHHAHHHYIDVFVGPIYIVCIHMLVVFTHMLDMYIYKHTHTLLCFFLCVLSDETFSPLVRSACNLRGVQSRREIARRIAESGPS